MSLTVDEHLMRRSREAFAARVEPIAHLLVDDRITDIMLNAASQAGRPGSVWVDVAGEGLRQTDVKLMPNVAERLIREFGASAGGQRRLDATHPRLSCRAALGQFRVEALIPPAVVTPTITIRKYIKRQVSLGAYVDAGELTRDQSLALRAAASDGETVVIGGETGCGKTTLLNPLLAAAAAGGSRRLLIIEDTPELECPEGPNSRIEVDPVSEFTYQEAVQSALRQRPNCIALGEIRRPEDALDAIEAWNTGHQGFGTLHAPSCTGMLWRVYSLCRQSERGRHVTQRAIADAIHVVVHMRRREGRRIIDVHRVVGWNEASNEFVLKGLV